MKTVALDRLVRCCDKTLRLKDFDDYPNAFNGLQVSNGGTVSRIAATVDASLATVKLAVEAGADLLLVHHGLFWGGSHPWTGKRYELLRILIANNLAVYSAHLPLDCHPQLGNNARLCAALGFRRLKPFFFDHGCHLGFRTRQRMPRAKLGDRLKRVLGGSPRLLACGPETCERIGIVSGGAGGDLKLAASEGVDTFVTGEGPHWTFAMAEEMGINVFYGGHYATEVFGVQALASELGRRFRLPWCFLDHPSGL